MLGMHLNIREAVQKDKQSTKSLKWKKEKARKTMKEGTKPI